MRTTYPSLARTPVRGLMLIAGLFALVAAVACASSGSPPPSATSSPARVGVRPGDAVLIKVWREPDLSDTAQVNEDGRLVLPLLGERQVTGMTPDSLRTMLEHDYREYLDNPSVEVKVLRRVAILGEVRQPGLYPVDATVSLADALAMAGGVTRDGNKNDIELIRDGVVVRQSLNQVAAVGAMDVRSGDHILVGQRSWFSRNFGIISAFMGVVTSLTIAIIVRG